MRGAPHDVGSTSFSPTWLRRVRRARVRSAPSLLLGSRHGERGDQHSGGVDPRWVPTNPSVTRRPRPIRPLRPTRLPRSCPGGGEGAMPGTQVAGASNGSAGHGL